MMTTADKNLKGILLIFCMILMTVFLTQTSVYALTGSGNVSDGKGVKITKANTIVDSITFNGTTVNAIYKPKKGVSNYNSDSTYCCAAFVSRFYKQVYGITVNNLYPGNTPNVASGTGSFVKTSSPKVGDIYGNSGHWAIVKAVSGNNIYLIEQNYWWNANTNTAGKGRIVPLKGNHWYFTWTGVQASKVSLNRTSATVSEEKGFQLTASITPANTSVKTVTWKSWNTSVATVNAKGHVSAKGPGTTLITATTSNGKKATCKVTVLFNKTVYTTATNADAGIVLTYTNVNNETGYKICRREGNGSFKVIGRTAANVTRVVDTSAKPGKTYTYVVYPVRGSYTGYAAAKTITRLSTPVISSVKAAFGRKVTVTWNKAAGSPTHYMITYKTGNRTSSIKVKASSLKTVNGKYTYTISNLGFWKNNKITVTALKGSYRSNASAARTVKVTR